MKVFSRDSGIPIEDRPHTAAETKWAEAVSARPNPDRALLKDSLEQEISHVLDEGSPLTCGEITKKLEGLGCDVRRSAVDRALARMRDAGDVTYQWTPLERNGFMVIGRVYMAFDHVRDSDCMLDKDSECITCHVFHGDSCPVCGGRGFHNAGCREMDS